MSEITENYMGFTQNDRMRKLSSALVAIGMVLLAIAFITVEPILSMLYILIGVMALFAYSSSDAMVNLYSNKYKIFLSLTIISFLVFGVVFK
ncbi:hypothetical protein [Natrinema ejinorense]|uniref:hypothetical protein n=1 Tax=Natrinema ejinorense TaxID=373386 RepID=UPI0014762020|nr:hypothetical protein [Natrinema ejinorense]